MMGSDQQEISSEERRKREGEGLQQEGCYLKNTPSGRISALYKPQWRRSMPMEKLPMALLTHHQPDVTYAWSLHGTNAAKNLPWADRNAGVVSTSAVPVVADLSWSAQEEYRRVEINKQRTDRLGGAWLQRSF
jgi:hypothetical protein